MKCLLDMDGVCVDFVSPAMAINGAEFDAKKWPKGVWDIEKVIGVSTEEFWKNIDLLNAFWESLEMYPWIDELIQTLDETFESWAFCSTPSRCEKSASGKVLWIQKHFGDCFRDYYLCAGSKAQLANSETVLVDDNDKNCGDFIKAGGKAVLWPQPWNMSNKSVDETILEIRGILE